MVFLYNFEKFPKLLQQMTKHRHGNYVYPEKQKKKKMQYVETREISI